MNFKNCCKFINQLYQRIINKKNKNSSFSLIEKTKISIQRRNVSIHRKEKKKSQISKKLTLFILRISKLAKLDRWISVYFYIRPDKNHEERFQISNTHTHAVKNKFSSCNSTLTTIQLVAPGLQHSRSHGWSRVAALSNDNRLKVPLRTHCAESRWE